jgi:hypothetical protein
MSDALDDAIETAATEGVSRVTLDGTTVESFPLRDQIAAAEHLAARVAAGKNHLGLTFRRLEPGGCG